MTILRLVFGLLVFAAVAYGVWRLVYWIKAKRLEAERLRLLRLENVALERERNATKRAEKRPLLVTMPTKDEKLTYVKVRPTTGDELPRSVLDELEKYVAGLTRKEIHRKLQVEYRDGAWQKVKRH
jgi:hypothetical protein